MAVSAITQFILANATQLAEALGFPLIVMAFCVIIAGYLAYLAFRESVFALLIVQVIIFTLFIAFLLPVLILAFV